MKTIKNGTIHNFKCYDREGNLVWREDNVHNLVVTTGLNNMLDEFLSGSSYTAAFYVGLKSTGTAVLADTMASHASWTELTIYSEGTREALTFGAAAAGVAAGVTVSFSINGSGTIGGTFITTDGTKAATAGTLIVAADFSSSHTVESGYTLDDDITFTLAN